MSIETLYLHVGMQKTATSSIQQTLATNRKILKEKSILYPESWSAWHVKEFGNIFPNEIEEERRNILYGRNKLSEKELESLKIKTIQLLKSEIEKCKIKNLVLSAENLMLFSEKNLIELERILRENIKIKNIIIILYTREKVSFLNSIIQQYVKSSFTLEYDIVIDKYKNCYYDFINKFINVFGKENMKVFKFEEACKDDYGPVGFFLKNIGIDDRMIKNIDIKKANEGISDKAVDIINYINSNIPLVEYDKISNKRTPNDTNELFKIRGERFIVDPIIAKNIINFSKNDILWLKNTFHIDYTNHNSSFKEPNLVFDQKYFEDMQLIFPKLSDEIQRMIINYLEVRNTETFNEILNNLLFWIMNYLNKDKK